MNRNQYQMFATLLLAASLGSLPRAQAQSAAPQLPESWQAQVRALIDESSAVIARNVEVHRIEVTLGMLDARLKLAACDKVEAYLPAGQVPWGALRVGLRCRQGSVPWNVYLPVSVKVYGPALVVNRPIAIGERLAASDLQRAEVDLAEQRSAAVLDAATANGRIAARALAPGRTLREQDLKPRQWFAAGERVVVIATGEGFAVSGEGVALNAGLEKQSVRVRTESGRIVTGEAVGERRVEVDL